VDVGRIATTRTAKTLARSACIGRRHAFLAGRMLVRTHDGAVDHLNAILPATAVVQRLQNYVAVPDKGPTPELAVDRRPFAESLAQVAPGHARAGGPKYPI
jgi:hypothetical protein